MSIELTREQREALEASGGFVEGDGFMLMSREVYLRMRGIESEQELEESLAAINQGLADVEAGRNRPLREFFEEFRAKHQLSD